MPFNNMWTLKFKIQPTITLFTAVNHCSGPLTKQKRLPERGQKVMFVRCDWWISVHFVGFCIFCGQSRLNLSPEWTALTQPLVWSSATLLPNKACLSLPHIQDTFPSALLVYSNFGSVFQKLIHANFYASRLICGYFLFLAYNITRF